MLLAFSARPLTPFLAHSMAFLTVVVTLFFRSFHLDAAQFESWEIFSVMARLAVLILSLAASTALLIAALTGFNLLSIQSVTALLGCFNFLFYGGNRALQFCRCRPGQTSQRSRNCGFDNLGQPIDDVLTGRAHFFENRCFVAVPCIDGRFGRRSVATAGQLRGW